jgi:hypothetical protein
MFTVNVPTISFDPVAPLPLEPPGVLDEPLDPGVPPLPPLPALLPAVPVPPVFWSLSADSPEQPQATSGGASRTLGP